MKVQVKSAKGTELFPIESILLDQRKIFLEGEITDEKMLEFSQQLMYLLEKNSDLPVRVFIDSPGGSVSAGLCITDMLLGVDTVIETISLGNCCSMAAVIFACGTKRTMLEHTKLMLHPASYNGSIGGNLTEMMQRSQMLENYERATEQILADRTGHTIKEIEEASSYEHWFSADEAIQFGLADQKVKFKELVGWR